MIFFWCINLISIIANEIIHFSVSKEQPYQWWYLHKPHYQEWKKENKGLCEEGHKIFYYV